MRPRHLFFMAVFSMSAVQTAHSQGTANTPKKPRRPSGSIPVPAPPPPPPAASARPGQCPVISVSSPTEVRNEQPITFTVSVRGGDANVTPTFNWTVSAGTISSGQGTSTITVDTQGVAGQSVTATVDLGGYEARCRTTQSATTGVAPRGAPARKIDEYGVLSLVDQSARLDNYAIELQNDPGSRGYIIAFNGRGSPAGGAAARLKIIRDYLVQTRGIPAMRLITINGGPRERSVTELWIVPEGAKPPR